MINRGFPVQKTVLAKILSGAVLSTYKTKAGIGRKSVTVGPYRQAVGPRKFAVIIGGEATVHGTAIEATLHFIEYVGRADAWAAANGRGRERNPK